MEHHMTGSEDECREIVIEKVKSAFRRRGWELADLKIAVTSGKVEKIGAAFAAVVLWT